MSAAEATLFAALGDPTRLALVARLSGGDLSIARLGDGLPMSRQAVRKHLSVLEGAGLVHAMARGREQHYSLRRERIEEARAYLERVAAQWDTLLARLKDQIEEKDA